MPVRTRIIRETGASVLEHWCEVCGKDAYFGYGASLLRAYKAKDAGNIDLAKELLGKWYCGEHKPEDKE